MRSRSLSPCISHTHNARAVNFSFALDTQAMMIAVVGVATAAVEAEEVV